MNEKDMLSAVSFLLGTVHGGLVNILNSGQTHAEKIDDLRDLSHTLRKEISRLYYGEIIDDLKTKD